MPSGPYLNIGSYQRQAIVSASKWKGPDGAKELLTFVTFKANDMVIWIEEWSDYNQAANRANDWVKGKELIR